MKNIAYSYLIIETHERDKFSNIQNPFITLRERKWHIFLLYLLYSKDSKNKNDVNQNHTT